ncbi:hypothetical protein CCACVL1_06348 [Corchorus capsularis]|uniref:Uncharacterized protein n=1 Tax=Corchorus capsularis TaxID=210143 RepID=A0A1R3JG38_COCAP|nr:hypothetical protein CCACVL1_06348 [Corchorus capsularis]
MMRREIEKLKVELVKKRLKMKKIELFGSIELILPLILVVVEDDVQASVEIGINICPPRRENGHKVADRTASNTRLKGGWAGKICGIQCHMFVS